MEAGSLKPGDFFEFLTNGGRERATVDNIYEIPDSQVQGIQRIRIYFHLQARDGSDGRQRIKECLVVSEIKKYIYEWRPTDSDIEYELL